MSVDGVAAMLELARKWTMDVERGPDWLFIRLHGPENRETEPWELANRLWQLMEQHFTYRLVLELDDVPLLSSYLLGQLVMLHKLMVQHITVKKLDHLKIVNVFLFILQKI